MALLVVGKSVCPICKLPILSQAEAVGFPPMELPAALEMLSDACMHRGCLIAHPLRSEIANYWSFGWKAQAKKFNEGAICNDYGALIFISRRLVFVSFRDFIEIEETRESVEGLRNFFVGAELEGKKEITLDWNVYRALTSDGIIRFTVSPAGKMSHVSSSPSGEGTSPAAVLDHSLPIEDWRLLSSVWRGSQQE
jgi:hypothetical protein